MTFQRNRGAVRPLAVVGVLLLCVAGVGGWAWQGRARRIEERRWAPIVMPERTARVTDEWDAETLAERLKKSGKLRETELFAEAAREVGLTSVAEGGYELPEKAGPRELAKIFKAPPTLKKITFPEGWTVAKMSARLAQNGFSGAAALHQMAYPSAQAVSPIEGKLFPETYYLPVSGDAKRLVKELRGRFYEVWKGLAKDDKSRPRVKGKPLSDEQIIVLASLVERESAAPEESPLIAGVLVNRLNKGMRLQCDASVQYARMRAELAGQLGEGHKERLLFRDLEIESPYNTYRVAGLPPGAICNPGEASLRAALMPKPSPYFFYVLSPKLKKHRFARTFDEHRRNIRLAQNEK
jgi:UPF0755 protein